MQQGVALSGNQAAIDAYNSALADGATQEDAFNAALAACNTEQERAQLITDTLNGVYAEAGAQYQQTNADVIAYRQSQSDLTAAMSSLGQAFMPIVTGLTNVATMLLSGVQPAVQWFVTNLPIIAPILAGIVTTIGLLAVVLNASTIATTAQTVATNAAAAAQGLLNMVMNANPIALIVTLIAGLVVAIIGLWNNSEAFRNFVTGAFQQIQQVAQVVIDAIVNFFTVTVPNAIGVVIGFFQNLWNSIVSVFNGALSTVSGFVSSVVSFFTVSVPNAVSNMLSAGWPNPRPDSVVPRQRAFERSELRWELRVVRNPSGEPVRVEHRERPVRPRWARHVRRLGHRSRHLVWHQRCRWVADEPDFGLREQHRERHQGLIRHRLAVQGHARRGRQVPSGGRGGRMG